MTSPTTTALQHRKGDAASATTTELVKQRQDHWRRLEAALNRYVTGLVRKDMYR